MKRYAMVMAAMLAAACGGNDNGAPPATAKREAVVGGQAYTLQGFPTDTLRAADGSPRLLMVGSDKPFRGVKITLSQAAPTSYRGALEVWYHATPKPSDYFGETNMIRAADGTVNVSQDGSITWTAPADWVPGYWLAATDPDCDETCKAVNPAMYWVGVTLAEEPMPPDYNPCPWTPDPAFVPAGCDPSLPLFWSPPPAPPVSVTSIELL